MNQWLYYQESRARANLEKRLPQDVVFARAQTRGFPGNAPEKCVYVERSEGLIFSESGGCCCCCVRG